MSVEIQLASFLAFFLFGSLLTIINFTLLQNHKKTIYPVSLILTVSFMYIVYKLNGGNIHIYFIAIFILGIITSKITVKYIKILLRRLKQKSKR